MHSSESRCPTTCDAMSRRWVAESISWQFAVDKEAEASVTTSCPASARTVEDFRYAQDSGGRGGVCASRIVLRGARRRAPRHVDAVGIRAPS